MDKEKKKRPGKPRGPTPEPPALSEAARLELDALRAELGLPPEEETPDPNDSPGRPPSPPMAE